MPLAQTKKPGWHDLPQRFARIAGAASLSCTVLWLLNWLSYRVLNGRILKRRTWDLNICCGKTDGGGVNVDIVRHAEVPSFVLVDDIYRLPFGDKQFGTVLCSHTMEHVERPADFYHELKRVGREVTIVVPPLWDVSAACNLLEHKWVFLSLNKEHRTLPRHFPMPLALRMHRWLGQRIHA